MKYEVVQSPKVHEPMGLEYAGMPIYSQAFSVDLKTFDRLVIIARPGPAGQARERGQRRVCRPIPSGIQQPEGHRRGCGREDGEHHLPADPVSREDDLPIFHRLRGEFYPQLFGGKALPPNTLLVVKQLVLPEIRLEIEAIAAI